MIKVFSLLLILVLVSQVDAQSKKTAPQLTKTDFMTGLDNPWDMAFMSDGTMFFTEKCKGLSVRTSDGKITRLFGTAGSKLVANDLFCDGQSGMNGVAIDPHFSSQRSVYVFMSSNQTNPPTNRVVKLTVEGNYATVSNRRDIITDIPFKFPGNSWGGPGQHSGGRLRFGPDGFLYVTTGDNHNGPLPQDRSKLGGKTLRVSSDGMPAPGNNAPAGTDQRIFTYGHRNVQGICFRPSNGQAYSAEHGPKHSDEVTPLVAGGNGGWDPRPEEGVTCEDNYCGYISNKKTGELTPMTDLKKYPQAMKPLTNYKQSMGMSPCTFVSGSQWKAWDGALLVGMLAGQRVDVLELGSKGELLKTTKAPLPEERIRSLVQSYDGNLYVATDSGNIWKVVPK